ncbi:MAG TPA: phosphoribosylaminoimidazolesuccinocarboxamide synthase [Abditibacteriaceae bacterium]|jgi:phosphoribosylaminoimidazole-succinocarboxamide synthase
MLFSDLKPTHSGKVRDIYEAGDHLVIVASDRISAFDCILPTPIPDKGKILTRLSLFWFEKTKHLLPNHLISAEVQEFPSPFNQFKNELAGRSMLVKRAEVLPIECVVRGYLAGSGWKEYQKSQSVCGVPLPPGLRESDKLPQPIFTPTTKAQAGHDLPITWQQTVELVGEDKATKARDASLSLYSFAADYALQKGIIIADTKFELGLYEGELILVDEALTPDSSRFWDIEKYAPGRAQESFDKQFLRDYLETLDWDKTPPAPQLPHVIVQGTAAKYREALERLTT